jgi:hypothetical protein
LPTSAEVNQVGIVMTDESCWNFLQEKYIFPCNKMSRPCNKMSRSCNMMSRPCNKMSRPCNKMSRPSWDPPNLLFIR